MKIWIVEYDCGDFYCSHHGGGKHLCSVWTTRAAAEHLAATCAEQHKPDNRWGDDRHDHEVIEAELSGHLGESGS